jgi:GTP pyrophosphokinase
VAEEAHSEQKRHSGEPYINHCLAVASILADLQVPPEVVAAGLLHDTVEDTTITLNDIRRDFGNTIAVLVDGVTKLTNLPRVSRDDQHAENGNGNNEANQRMLCRNIALGRKQDPVSETLRKTFSREMTSRKADQLADLHNMRTLGLCLNTSAVLPRKRWIFCTAGKPARHPRSAELEDLGLPSKP